MGCPDALCIIVIKLNLPADVVGLNGRTIDSLPYQLPFTW